MEGAGRKTVFRTELRLKFVTSPVVKQVPGVGRMTAQLRQLKFQSYFFSPQIKHKVYLSLVRRLEGHSSQSISGSIRRKNSFRPTVRKSAKRGHCTRAEQECCIMTDLNSQSTNLAKTVALKKFEGKKNNEFLRKCFFREKDS